MGVNFGTNGNGDVEITDSIQRRHYKIERPSDDSVEPANEDDHRYPVDESIRTVAKELTLPGVVSTFVRDQDGEMLTELQDYDFQTFDDGPFIIELGAPIKLYLRFDTGFSVGSTGDRMQFSFESPTRVQIGARSYHDQPSATIRTTTEPAAIVRAVSALSSSLKTTTCERSWPSLRGHPPLIEVDDHFDVPDEVSPPDTGVLIETPPEPEAVFPLAPLVYYLGASMEIGDQPRLVAGDTDLRLPTGEGLERRSQRLLKQFLTLDAITRTEGLYDVDLHERRRLESRLGESIDFEELYEAPLPDQIDRYLDVPWELVSDLAPTWRLAVDVEPGFEFVNFLPYVFNHLGIVRTNSGVQTEAVETELTTEADLVRSVARPQAEIRREQSAEEPLEPAQLPPTDALEHAWVGDGPAFGANKMLIEGSQHLTDWEASDEITITVVCTDEQMQAEGEATSLYGDREEIPFDVRYEFLPTTDELASILEEQIDFLHYIGHVENGDLVCSDGHLDVSTLDEVNVGAFLMNGCRSYEPAIDLVKAGSVAGIATLADVSNVEAVKVGILAAEFLNAGFSLRSALKIIREHQIVGEQYVVVGDGSVSITQPKSSVPLQCNIRQKGQNRYDLSLTTFPSTDRDIGSLFRPHINHVSKYYLNGGYIDNYN
ncbi:MAG: hypothetical protein ACOC0F_02325, partial [archaeon]